MDFQNLLILQRKFFISSLCFVWKIPRSPVQALWKAPRTELSSPKNTCFFENYVVVEKIFPIFGGKLPISYPQSAVDTFRSPQLFHGSVQRFSTRSVFFFPARKGLKPSFFLDGMRFLEICTKTNRLFCAKLYFFHTVFHKLWKTSRETADDS